jgi:hypothetical protein
VVRVHPCLTPGSPFGPQTVVNRRELPGHGYGTRAPETATLQAVCDQVPPSRSACHAEGRGFESHQPLRKRPAFAGLFRVRSWIVRLRSRTLIGHSRRSSPGSLTRRRAFAGEFCTSERLIFCRPAEALVFAESAYGTDTGTPFSPAPGQTCPSRRCPPGRVSVQCLNPVRAARDRRRPRALDGPRPVSTFRPPPAPARSGRRRPDRAAP